MSVSGASANRGVAHELRERAAEAESDERPEDGILDHAREELGAAGRHLLDHDVRPDPLRGAPHGRLVAETERDAAGFRLVRARHGGLHRDWEAELACRCDSLLG